MLHCTTLPSVSVEHVSTARIHAVESTALSVTGDVVKIRKAVIGGSLAPLVMFLLWNAVILGTVPKDAGLVAEAVGGVFDPLQVRSHATMKTKKKY